MLARIKALFDVASQPETPLPDEQRKLAAAALLIEVAVIDGHFDERELASVHELLRSNYGIQEDELLELTTIARQSRDDASSVYEFTSIINKHCTDPDKYELVKGLWTIAYADGELDKYEEYIIRKISELLYVPHSEFIRAKLDIRAQHDA